MSKDLKKLERHLELCNAILNVLPVNVSMSYMMSLLDERSNVRDAINRIKKRK